MGTNRQSIRKFSSSQPYPYRNGKPDDRIVDVSVNTFDTSGDDNNKNDEETIDNVQFNCDHSTHYDSNATWSLQDAIATALEKFLDKLETVNHWQCGLDLDLNTWKDKV
ncbi:unnamed protein product, partial [Rotaria sp. Silwood1]